MNGWPENLEQKVDVMLDYITPLKHESVEMALAGGLEQRRQDYKRMEDRLDC